jgi:hypothetical protein
MMSQRLFCLQALDEERKKSALIKKPIFFRDAQPVCSIFFANAMPGERILEGAP